MRAYVVNLKVKSKLALLVGTFVVGFLVFGGLPTARCAPGR
jgi:hypothetical protein